MLLASGCGHESSKPSGRLVPLVRELHVESDYGQIYIYDAEAATWSDDDTEDDNPLSRALDDASNARRFVGYDSGRPRRRPDAQPVQLEGADADRGERRAPAP